MLLFVGVSGVSGICGVQQDCADTEMTSRLSFIQGYESERSDSINILSKTKTNSGIIDFLLSHQLVRGLITYSDGSNIPNGVPVTITNLNNSNSDTRFTQQAIGGPGFYLIDVAADLGGRTGHIIFVNVSYGGCVGNGSVVLDSTGAAQWVNVTIYGNLPPNVPSQPSGLTTGYRNVQYIYSTNTTDPDGDDIYYWFDWGDGSNSGWLGPYSSGVTVNASNSWSSFGTYPVKVKAKDVYGAELGVCWSDPLNVTIVSQPPNTPHTPSGPIFLNAGVSGTYSTNTTDPDGDMIQYRFDWDANGSHTYSDWTGFVPSGTTVSMNHSWSRGGTYVVKAQARDQYNATSDWSNGLTVFVNSPPNTPSNPNPANGATGVDINADIYWTGGDPNPGDTVTYDIYFGTSSNPPMVASGITATTYDPGTMNYNTKYYWKIVAKDNHGAMTTGPIWHFTTIDEPNDPPYIPSNPNPENSSTNVYVDTTLSWTGGDPNPGDTVFYDVYLEANNPDPDVKVASDITETTFDPGTLEYETTYYWKIVAKDNHGAMTTGPIWHFTTENTPIPDLNCIGSLGWSEVKPGSTVTGSFIVENIGEPSSMLNWAVVEWPSWGTWTFTPSNGSDLTPEDGTVTVQVSVVAPNQQNQEFTGNVKVVNLENNSDFEIIPVSLVTPVNQISSVLLSRNLKVSNLFSKLVSMRLLFL